MWLCVLSSRPFEETHENAQWSKVKQMQPMWLRIFSGRQFEDTHAIQKSRKIPVFYFQKSRYRYLSPIPVYRYFPVYRRGLAVRADRMTSLGRQVTGGSVFSAESRSTISQNLLDSKLIRGGSNFLTSSSLSKKISENYILVLGYSNSAFLHSPNHGPLTQTLPRLSMDDQKYV